MSIGYACLTLGVPNTDLKSCIQKNATEEKLLEVIENNLISLENIVDYNIKNYIKLFRISSDLIPFGSSPVNQLIWWDIFADRLRTIGDKVKQSGMRVSAHPGQYTVLNSPNPEVVVRAMEDLNYHARLLDALGVGAEHKIVLHIGGIYNEKPIAMQRFIDNYSRLEDAVKQRLVLENDDKSYNIQDVLTIATAVNAPVIFDNLHNKINPVKILINETNEFVNDPRDEFYWINECKKTWKEQDGKQKMHYSQQNPNKPAGAHSETIYLDEFVQFYERLNRNDIDIMLEVKDKNLSAVKCINAVSGYKNVKQLEVEWSKYKYTVLEKSHTDYLEIRKILKDKQEYPVIPFYNLIEHALQLEDTVGGTVNAAQHVWGYFKEAATEKEKKSFLSYLEQLQADITSVKKMKNFLWKMTEKYQEEYLLNSYYFIL